MVGLAESLEYLDSEAAVRSLRRDAYWPKWDSPWWHMMLLHEMGETRRIPPAAIEALVLEMEKTPSTEFLDGSDYHCHCALGCVYQLLAAYGIDVDGRLPWIRQWFLRYQMSDGGFNCDAEAYAVPGECPSSMVGTIAPFEAMLFYTPRDFTAEEIEFMDRGARFLQERELWRGSPTRHNAEEREQAKAWMDLCFPRFYFYDVLRGLYALLNWADRRGVTLERARFAPVLERLEAGVEIGRRAYLGVGTRLPEGGRAKESLFPLLEAVSGNGPSRYLQEQWQKCRELGAKWFR
ncbi:MAG: hypothetical protein KIS61_19025 [Candidatus Eremiobacteraeota bacterium]|nr:hypothetical protein [Candidatus Eremiobacteraeota bacterium]